MGHRVLIQKESKKPPTVARFSIRSLMAEHDDHCIKAKKKSHVHSLLLSKSPSDIRRLLMVEAAALIDHCGANGLESDALRLAVDHLSKTQSWTLWSCPRCSLTFPQPEALTQHAVKTHTRPDEQLSSSLMPKRVERDRVDSLLADNWEPIEADPERAQLLERIRSAILKLAQFDILSCSQVNILFKIAGNPPAAQSSALSFRSLPPSKLRVMVTLLQRLISEFCSDIERTSSICCNESEEIEEVERVLINGDGSKLVVNANQFLRQSCVPDVGALVDWLYHDDDDGEKDFSDWIKLRQEKRNRGNEIFEKIREELERLETMCMKKLSCLRYRSAVMTLEKVFLDLLIKTGQSQESVMRKIRGDLVERTGKDNDVLRHVAANVHKEAESLKACKMRNLVKLVKQKDNSTGEAFQKQLWDSDFEETKCDARLLRKSIDIRQLEGELECASALDYLAVVVPLVKSFLRRCLEDEAAPDAAAGSA